MSGTLSLADFKTIMDSMAKQASDLAAALTSAGFANNRATILAESDLVVDGALGAAFGVDPTLNLTAMYAARLAALKANLGDLSAYLLANDSRVHRNINTLLSAGIKPTGIWPAPMTGANKLGNYAATGATTGTFTDGAAVDTTKYGKAWLQLHVTHAIGASLVATIIGTKLDGSAQSVPVTLTGHIIGDLVAVGTLGSSADHFKDVTNVTITGGTALDAFEIESVEERTIAL
jgi:hypothetical protein